MKLISELLKDIKVVFQGAGLDTPELDARLLVQYALGMTQEEMFLNSQKEISDNQFIALKGYVERRLRHEPVSRIIGKRAFWKSDFNISAETLDPRADSETLIEVAISLLPKDANLRVLDLGTGSGCLLLSLLQELPQASGVGLDISQGAVAVAKKNSEVLGVAGRSCFVAMDWESYSPDQAFDIVISNPPYIAESEMSALSPEVVLYDPVRALVADDNGLGCYRSIMKRLSGFLKPEGLIFLEIGYKQAKDVSELLARTGLNVVQIFPDLAGNDRVVVAKMP